MTESAELPNIGAYSRAAREVINLFRGILPKDGVLPGKEKRQFDTFIEPTFRSMSKYHLQYTKIFGDALHLLSDEIDKKHTLKFKHEIKDPKIAKKSRIL